MTFTARTLTPTPPASWHPTSGVSTLTGGYVRPVPTPDQEVADELRQRLPDLPPEHLPPLLALAQHHHQAWFGQPLEAPGGGAFGERELNTIGYVASRYGNLDADELDRHAANPPAEGEVTVDPAQLEAFLAEARSKAQR